MPAVKQHKKLLPPWLLLGGTVFLAILVLLTPPVISAAAAGTIKACLIHTIDTSQWSPPSPDPMGITLLPNGHLLVSDSEVEECVNNNPPVYWHGVNLFEADRSGTLLAIATTYTNNSSTCPIPHPTGTASNFTDEPTGIAINPSNHHLLFSDDDRKKIFEVDLGPDGRYGTADDSVTSFSATALNTVDGIDPEGVGFGLGDLFVADGGQGGSSVYQIDPGPNGRFDGIPPAGDDVVVNHFDTASLGAGDPEGVTFNSDTGTLYIVTNLDKHLIETTTTGVLVNQIDITSLNPHSPGDVVYAPSSLNPAVKHLYIVDRGVDNNTDPNANDGKIYEISLDPAECGQPTFDFSLSNGGDRSVTQGSSVTNTITATLVSGTSQPVTFSASGLPTGASASFSAPSCTPTCSTTLTLTTSASTPTGPFPITVTGSGGGVTRTTRFTLTVNAASTFDFSLSNGGDRSVTQGSSVTNTITATLVSGTSQPVTFSASGLPTGASASFSAPSCTPTCSTTLTLTTSASTPTGPFPITVTGSGGGVTHTTSFTLTVNAPSTFDFSLSNGGDRSVTQGSSITNTITATLVSGTSQPVAFSASGLPAGASASFSAPSCTPTCSTTLTLTTSASTPTGPFPITVTGSGGGVTHTTSFTLTVNAPSTFDFSLSNGGDRSVTQGSSVTNTITATLVSGTSQPVTFSASGLPTGASAFFSSTSCTPTCSTTLTLTTSASTPTGPFPITVTGSGGVTRTTRFTLTVNAAPSFDFSLANGGDRSVTQGSSVTNTITATLVSGPSQSVTFSASGLPAGASASFSAPSCTPTCSTTLTLTTSASTSTGPFPITVTGSGGGVTHTTSFTLTVKALPPPPSNLLLNPGFELDANGDGKPDSWSTSSKFTRSSEEVHSGSFAGKFLVTDNSSSTVNQTVNNLTAGTTYSFSGWVNIPPTIGLSTFRLRVRWLNASDGLISAQTIKSYTALTLGWDQATASMVAPAGTTHAQVEMTVETLLLNLNTTVYVDDFVFKQ